MGKLLRNREVRLYLLVVCCGAAVLLPICFLRGPWVGGAAAALFVLTAAGALLFTHRRHRRLEELADELGRISAGSYTVDIQACAEGELSILAGELVKITRTLSHQAQSLRREKRYLADALADISHQLKTPLTSVSMMTELLASPDLPPEKRDEFLGGVRQGTDRIRWLVEALLKLSRLDAGAVEFRREPIPLDTLLGNALAPLRAPLEIKGLTLLVTGAQGLTVTGDRQWLAEALGNLLKNCVEHTPPGGEVTVTCGQNPLFTRIDIADNGPGIAPEDLPHIFERFYRGKNAGADSVGIGLALSRSILGSLNGAVTAENPDSGGARFCVKLYTAST